MKNKILNNLGLKILALVTAIVLWLIVLNISDPVISTTFSGIPVEVLNGSLLTADGKVYEVLDDTDSISVTVAAKRTVLDYLNDSNLRATADLKELNEADGTIRIRVESNRYNNQIDSIKPKTEYLKIKVENKKSAQFPITPDILGEPKEGYVVGNVSMNQNIVYVSGPESLVNQIVKVTTEVSVEGMSGSVSTNMKLKFYDRDGTLLDDSRLVQNITSVDLDVEILATKEVPVTATVSGIPMQGYGVKGEAVVEPATVKIAGKNSVLNEIQSIQIPGDKISVDGLNSDLNTAVKIGELLPDGIRLVDEEQDGKILVAVEIEELAVQTVELPKSQISINGVPEGYTADFGSGLDTVSFDVMGLEDVIKNFDVSGVIASVNIREYMDENHITRIDKSSYLIPVTMVLPEGVSLKVPVNVNIQLKEIEE